MCGSFFHFPAKMKRPGNGRRQCPNGGTGRREKEEEYPLTDARRVRNETRPTRTRVCDIFHFVVFVFNIYRSLFGHCVPVCYGVVSCGYNVILSLRASRRNTRVFDAAVPCVDVVRGAFENLNL